ncbi:MAG: BREX-1 system adenine-specific DNA-methyltransferase PglX [Chloroflexota bacterium]|nr:BREX-1 system adenine-specific DNA-methyltransferase PglX [Chloroflexota bacterium]
MSDTARHSAQQIERVTAQFYARFKQQRAQFVQAIQGVALEAERERYATLLLNRLMFAYFLQHKGFLAGDSAYLLHQLQRVQRDEGRNRFYHPFLLDLFHEGFATPAPSRNRRAAFSNIPYLDGGLFAPSPLERSPASISIDDAAFEQVFTFFDAYSWHLDELPGRRDNEINPAILGYIFEKYINQQQMGAYYTREDVTAYIAKQCILPALFDRVEQQRPGTFSEKSACWQLVRRNPERYIPSALRRTEYLPGETRDEYQARRQYCKHLYTLIHAGAIHAIDDFITYNLDIERFAQDVARYIGEAEDLYVFYGQLRQLKVLDPTCGSGAFLFAALRVLVPLYEACLERGVSPVRRYFIVKSIISDTLYGVDIMEEAVAICKLRLFLTLLATVERVEDLEPLPEIDAHIRTGNALVGFTSAPQPGMLQDDAAGDETLALDRRLAQEYGVDSEDTAAFARWRSSHQPFHWHREFADVTGGFDCIIGNPPYVEYGDRNFPYTLRGYRTLSCANLYPCVVERSRELLSPRGRQGMILPLAAFATRNMAPLLQGFKEWFPGSWLSFYHFRPSMLFSGGKVASIPTTIYLARAAGEERRFSTHVIKWNAEQRASLFSLLTYCEVSVSADAANRYYYPKFGHSCENAIMEKVLQHTIVAEYLERTPNGNSMSYRSAGGLYWKIFVNFPWPYRTTSNKQCSFAAPYDRDVFVALFNSSLFWWYYTVTFDTFNLKNYMLFGFRFTYPENTAITGALKEQCQRLMQDFHSHARHLKRGETGSFTIYGRKSRVIIDEIDRILAVHYGLSAEELAFILRYDIKYRMGIDLDSYSNTDVLQYSEFSAW